MGARGTVADGPHHERDAEHRTPWASGAMDGHDTACHRTAPVGAQSAAGTMLERTVATWSSPPPDVELQRAKPGERGAAEATATKRARRPLTSALIMYVSVVTLRSGPRRSTSTALVDWSASSPDSIGATDESRFQLDGWLHTSTANARLIFRPARRNIGPG
jgi:hypothetical protein